MSADLEDDFAFLHQLSRVAAEVVLPRFRTELAVDNKAGSGAYDPVTEADREAELAIRAAVLAAHPGDAFIGEEFGAVGEGAARTWIVDPIDGTRSFVTGIPLWGTLVGRIDRGRPALGLMAQPYIGEDFLGDGNRAELWRNGTGRRLATSRVTAVADARLMSTSPAMFSPEEFARFERVHATARLARYGGDCYAYCMLAAGMVDLVVESSLQPYDIVALIPIVEGAGGAVATWDGGDPQHGGQVIAAATPALLEATMALLAT